MRSCSVEMDFDQRIQSFSSREFSMTKRNRHPNDDDGWFCGVWMATFFLYIPFFSLSFFNVKILLWLDFHLYLDTDAIIHSFRRMSQNEPRFHIFFFFFALSTTNHQPILHSMQPLFFIRSWFLLISLCHSHNERAAYFCSKRTIFRSKKSTIPNEIQKMGQL